MLGSAFLGFPQMQNFVSSHQLVLQMSQQTCRWRVPSSHFTTKWQTPEALQEYKKKKKQLSWLNWLASGLGRKENELLCPDFSESTALASLLPARCCTLSTRLRASLGFACCCCPHPVGARNTLLTAPCSVSSPSAPLFLTCMSPPSEKPPKATPRPPHLASVVLPISMIIIVCGIAVFLNALSDSWVCDPDLRKGHP